MSCFLPSKTLLHPVFAQNKKAGQLQEAAAIVPGKQLTVSDSEKVRQLFFAALREKTIENFKDAEDDFARVIQIDPANDASLFELANLKKIKNNYDDAQQLLEKAVVVNPDNEWYWTSLADCYEKKVTTL